jgi:tetratricopeptide (TPR) repeat protein
MDQIASNKVATASQRQQLQELFDRALRLKHGGRQEQESASKLFRQCFATDPGNLIYAQAWLHSLDDLAAFATPKKPIRSFVLSRAVKKAMARREWPQVIGFASQCLDVDSLSVKAHVALAEACSELAHDNVTILLLRRAVGIEEKSDEALRRLALALETLGDFAEARRCWMRVNELFPNDDEAKNSLAALVNKTGASQIAREQIDADTPQSVEDCLQQVEALVSHGQFPEADQYLGRATSLFGGDIRIRERAEQLLLDQARYEIEVAERRLEVNATSENQDLLDGLRGELNRREIDFYAARSQRYPDLPRMQLELGLRLKRAGIYAEAIAEFVDLFNDEMFPCQVPVEIGECWQSLRQFDRALTFYREAVKICPDSHECFKRSRYRAAVLLEAMKNAQQAESLLEEVLRVDSSYKDAATRLDRIKNIRHHM